MKCTRILITFLVLSTILASACSSEVNTTTTQETPVTTTSTSSQITTSNTSTTATPTNIFPEQLKVHFIDVGQGDSILIDFGQTEILIDGGDRNPGIVNYLNSYVDDDLEVLVATHPHADHIGGLIAVLQSFNVLEIWVNGDSSTSKTYSDFMNAVNSEGAIIFEARLHNTITAGELSLFVHNPSRLEGTTNNNSIVLSLAFGEIKFWFAGDAEVEAEGAMMMLSSVQLPDIDILKVGHHGSRTASSSDFLSIIQPEVAIYMAGIDNSYGHPHEETITTLNDIGAEIYGTDVNGTIVVTTNGETYLIRPER